MTSTQIELTYTCSAQLHLETDHAQEALQQALQKQSTLEQKRRTINARITQFTSTAHQMDTYTRKKATQGLRHLKKRLKKLTKDPTHPKKPSIWTGYLGTRLKRHHHVSLD